MRTAACGLGLAAMAMAADGPATEFVFTLYKTQSTPAVNFTQVAALGKACSLLVSGGKPVDAEFGECGGWKASAPLDKLFGGKTCAKLTLTAPPPDSVKKVRKSDWAWEARFGEIKAASTDGSAALGTFHHATLQVKPLRMNAKETGNALKKLCGSK